MFKVGCVGIDTSHPGSFLTVMREAGLKLKYTEVFNDGFRTDAEVSAFMEKAGIENRCERLEDMAEAVDIAFIHDCNWDRHLELAAPFIEAGVPVFLDKPVVGNLAACEKLEALVKGGAKILGGSSLRYATEVEALRNLLTENNEQPLAVLGTCGVDRFNYGIHIVEALHQLMGPGAESVSYIGVTQNQNHKIEQYVITWKTGARVTYQLQSGVWQPCHVMVQSDQAVHHREIAIDQVYLALLRYIESVLAGKCAPTDIEVQTEAIRIMLAGEASRERHGESIFIKDLPEIPVSFDGDLFSRDYAFANQP
ncbi:Gfo/Idh/MocA family oxidoreductase [Kiritimatiellaeota bacterium B1221]|nr:Gfo/Idh/MocA family oxidoreductase [Kiritimatiellaeota bacterium B1221]